MGKAKKNLSVEKLFRGFLKTSPTKFGLKKEKDARQYLYSICKGIDRDIEAHDPNLMDVITGKIDCSLYSPIYPNIFPRIWDRVLYQNTICVVRDCHIGFLQITKGPLRYSVSPSDVIFFQRGYTQIARECFFSFLFAIKKSPYRFEFEMPQEAYENEKLTNLFLKELV